MKNFQLASLTAIIAVHLTLSVRNVAAPHIKSIGLG